MQNQRGSKDWGRARREKRVLSVIYGVYALSLQMIGSGNKSWPLGCHIRHCRAETMATLLTVAVWVKPCREADCKGSLNFDGF